MQLQYATRTFCSVQRFSMSPRALHDESSKPDHHSAMSRRLSELTEQALEDASSGFSEELKEKLEQRIADSEFRNDNASAFSQANMPASADRATQQIAASKPWTGTESCADTVLRMLTDAHKPLKQSSAFKPPSPAALDVAVSTNLQMPKTGRKTKTKTAGERLASARDRTSIYMQTQTHADSTSERESLRAELAERFTAAARPMPATLSGFATLANERIEAAMARGQFKNIRRGKAGKSADTPPPFVDTTEYLMNRIIRKQDVMPPWIEKQQELAQATSAFRARLRADWKRHATTLIAGKGDSLREQVHRATAYAKAEAEARAHTQSQYTAQTKLRDVEWERRERAYHAATIRALNALTRSYNLIAPSPAQKPHVSLSRELDACYADVAPLLADELGNREHNAASTSTAPPHQNHRIGSGVWPFNAGSTATPMHVFEEPREKQYGLREYVKDLWLFQRRTRNN